MTATERQEWLDERKNGVGGSDCASVFNSDWGCRRRLWYDKRSVPPDFPREETLPMRLGTHLESFFSQQYAEKTGRTVMVHKLPFVHPEMPELRVNIDRSAYDESDINTPILLEIKSVGRDVFFKYKREGIPEAYVWQVQHGLVASGWTKGAFCIGCRDNGEIMQWDVPRSDVLCAEILIEVPAFWKLVENGPMPEALDPSDKRCSRCEYRVQCQGNALVQLDGCEMERDDALVPLVAERTERKKLLAQAEDLLAETEEELKSVLGDRQQVLAGDKKVYFRPQEGTTMYKGPALYGAYRTLRALMVRLVHENPGVIPSNDLIGAMAVEPESFVDKSKPSRPLRVF